MVSAAASSNFEEIASEYKKEGKYQELQELAIKEV